MKAFDSFSCIIYVFGVHTSGHGTNVPTSQFKSASPLRLCLSGDIISVYFSLKAIPIHSMRKVNCGETTP